MGSEMMFFSWVDYMVLAALLLISVAVGIYYGCFGTKQNTTEQYLHGGKKMRPFPIGMSLTASHVSGITLLGIPAEIYFYGTQYMMFPITVILLMLTLTYVFLPVYYKLQLASSFEYLKLRFGHETRSLASCLYALSTILYVPIVIYVPSLALNQVTGIHIYIISPVICAVCIFYTTLGGLKAVVFSDTIQCSITLLTMVTIFFIGLYQCGGFVPMWDKAQSRDRIEFFNMSLDPTVRQTVWSIVFGMGITFLGNWGINPSSIQRFLSMPTYKDVLRSVIIFAIGSILTKLLSCFIGLIIFARYIDCDPLTSGSIERVDQLLPYYMLDALHELKGLPGLFVASVLCTALSTMSTNINTLALTIYEDLIKSRLPKDVSQNTVNIIIKSIVVITGLICLLFIFVVEKLGGVLQIALSFHGLTLGPLVGLTLLGMVFPYANGKGALTGGICSLILTGILVGGAQVYTIQGKMKGSKRPLSTTGCEGFNETFPITPSYVYLGATNVMKPKIFRPTPEIAPEKPPSIFMISHYYFSVVGMMLVIIIGLLVSWITKKKDEPPVHRDLLSPCIYRFLSDNKNGDTELADYDSIEKALIKVQSPESKPTVNEIKC
ncbi:hypothetical protein FQR65_LT13625 [Abscondita terminalis]|nr:hypothetical protein FQR65_LT13625 [Abscondita terminalis]